MTKPRAPLSLENAVSRIIGHIGAAAAAHAVEQALGRRCSPRLIHAWSDPDARERLPADAIPALDGAYRVAGGEGAPCYETLSLLVDASNAERFADADALHRMAGSIAKESGEALCAVIAAARDGATGTDKHDATREVEQAIAAFTRTLPLLTKSTGHTGTAGEGRPGGGA